MPRMHRTGSVLEKTTLDDLEAYDMEGGLHDAFIDELRDAYDAEKQLIKALPKLAKAATAPPLRAAFLDHLEETRGHVERLEQVFASLDEKVRGKHCDGIAGIIEEGKSVMEEDFDGETLDACLIAAGQRSEHYEMAAYGTLVAWAEAMGHTKAARLLSTILDEEKAADEKLTSLATGGINSRAAAGPDEDESASGDGQAEGIGASIKRALFGGSKKRSAGKTRKPPAKRAAKKR
jgi:ferritin-like metal-binding protein YciE